MSEWLTCETVFCKKKLKILYSSDYPILIKFRQLVVNIVIKQLQTVFLTSIVIKGRHCPSAGRLKMYPLPSLVVLPAPLVMDFFPVGGSFTSWMLFHP